MYVLSSSKTFRSHFYIVYFVHYDEVNNLMYYQKLHYSIIYAYSLLSSSYIFRRYCLAIFRELTPTFL
jgi:hypothetical protein